MQPRRSSSKDRERGQRRGHAAVVPVMCPSGKLGFRKHVAQDKLDRYKVGDDRRAARPVRIYECGLCGGWHLTSQSRGD